MEDRVTKLTNAVYNLLEYFPESDPLKNKVKEKALEILENPKTENIDILLGYLKIVKMQGWLNATNYFIVANEYEKLRASLVVSAKAEIQSNSAFLDSRFRGNDTGKGGNDTIKSGNKASARQGKILEFLEKNEKAQVADLTKILPNVTKRTIRRDLDELIKVGQIERDGTFNQVAYRIIVSY